MGAVSVTEARRGYEFALSATLRASTVRERTQRLDTYLRWCDGRAPYERETVYAYLRDVRTRCSPMTHLGYFKALRAFFRWCEAERITSDDPMANLPMPRLSAEEKERDAPKYTEADKDALLSVCKDWTWMGQRDRALVLALWYTPLRARELCGLLVCDLRWEPMEIEVRKELAKGGRAYRFPLVPVLADAVHTYLRNRPVEVPFVWLEQRGSPLTPHGLRLMLRRLAERARLSKPIYPHAFRHNWRAYWGSAMGMSDAEVGALMGQRSVNATRGYGRSLLYASAATRYRDLAIDQAVRQGHAAARIAG